MKEESDKRKGEKRGNIRNADVHLLLKMNTLAHRKRYDGSNKLMSVKSGSETEI